MYPADFPDTNANESHDAVGVKAIRQMLPALTLVASIVLFALQAFVDRSVGIRHISMDAAIISSVTIMATLAVSVRTHGQIRNVWMLIAAGSIAWATGFSDLIDSSLPGNLIREAGYCLAVGSFVFSALALSHMEFRIAHRGQRALDLAPPVLALAIINWTVVVGPRVQESGAWSIEVLTGLFHGLGSSILLAISIAGCMSSRSVRNDPARRLIFCSLAMLAIADVLGQERVISSTGLSESAQTVASLVGFSLIAIAAVLGILRRADEHGSGPRSERPSAPNGVMYYLQFGALGLLLVLSILLRTLETTAPNSELIADIGALAVLVFIVARQSFVIRAERLLQEQIGDLSEQLDSLVSQVGRDPLTGLFNHRAVHERLDLELLGGKASGGTVAIVLIDVDNFKAINDTLGHQAGDRVLRAVSTILVSACRTSDVAARYAGDEFMLILPGLDERHAGSVCERIAAEVRRLNSDLHLGGGIQVTLSIGVAVTHNCDRNVVQNVAIADAAMYDAKESGKNRVVVVNADTLQISPPITAPTVDQLMAESRALFDWDSQQSTAS